MQIINPKETQVDIDTKKVTELKGVLDKAIVDSKAAAADTTKTAAAATAETDYKNQKVIAYTSTKDLNDAKANLMVDRINSIQLELDGRILDENNV